MMKTQDVEIETLADNGGSRMPHIYVILFVFTAIAALATHFIPAGLYDRVKLANGRTAIDPSTFRNVPSTPVGWEDFMMAVPRGLADASVVVFFTFIIGGMFMVIRRTGIIDVAVDKLTRRFAGRSILILPVLMTVFAVVATLIGTQELALVYVPVILPLMIALRFDSITALGVALPHPSFYLRSTPLAEPHPRMALWATQAVPALMAARARDELPTVANLVALASAVADKVQYRKGSTGVETTALEAFDWELGVCQDQAHVMVAVCRSIGLPARYVSGYFYAENEPDLASHAWADVCLDPAARRVWSHGAEAQLSRTELLNHIVRATDERLDLDRIFRVVCDNIESRFSTVYSAALLFDLATRTFTVAHLGTLGTELGVQVGLVEGDVLRESDSGLARCTGGELLYEPALADSAFDWPQRLARAGIGSAVFAPLQAQGSELAVESLTLVHEGLSVQHV